MKITTKNLTTAATLLFSLGALTVNAQTDLTPTATGVKLFCEGTDLNLGPAPENTEWLIYYSEQSGDETPEGRALTGGTTIPASELESGYYYVSTVGDASHPEICESEWEEVPIYVFKPLTVDFTAADYCIENAADQEFTADITSADAYTTYAYQWYKVDGTTETIIPGATAAEYQPDVDIAAGTTTTYRLKAGYLVGGLAYCSASGDNDVTVTAKPEKPTIDVGGGATGGTL